MTTPTRAGMRTRLVAVQAISRTQNAQTGSNAETWTTIKSVYAFIEALSGRELEAAQSRFSEVSHRLNVWYDPALWADPKVAATYRGLYSGRIFDIKGIMNIDEENREVDVIANEGVNDGN